MSPFARQTMRGLVPWGLLGMLVLVLASERFVARPALDFTRPDYFMLRRALAAGTRPSAMVVEYHPQCLAGDFDHAELLLEDFA